MTLSTRFDDLPDLILIEIFSYLSSFDILWGFTHLNQRITLLIVERKYFRYVNLSSARYRQFNTIVRVLLFNQIESLTIDINASSLQLSHWPFLPRLSTLRLEGAGISLKVYYPLCGTNSLVKNIILGQLHALRSLDLGTNEYSRIRNWQLTNISMPLTFLRIVLDSPYDVIRLMLTRPLSKTLKYLHITLTDIRSDFDFSFRSKDQLIPMIQLHTFTLVKSFLWKLKNELTFIDILTSANMMPVLRRISLSITLNNDELNCMKRCSIFNDYRCIDVHFVLCIDDYDANFGSTHLIPHGSLSYPREIRGSAFMINFWYNVGYSTTVRLSRWSRYKFDRRWLWYTVPWSFEKFFQIPILNLCDHEREIYASPSSSNIIVPSNISTLNDQANILPLPTFFPVGSRVLEHNNQSSFYDIDTIIRIIIPPVRIIVTDCFDTLTDYLYTGNLRSIHILFYLSEIFATINWNSLRTFSVLPLLKSLRITMYNSETILEDEHCQGIVERVPMLTDFVFCFRRNRGYINDDNDPFNIHRKSILNLHHHISILNFDQQPKILIEPDGCGLIIWL